MKISKEHLYKLLGELPQNIDCDYVIPGNFTLKLNSIENGSVCFSLYENGLDTNKNVTLTNEAISIMADGIIENIPVSIDTILVSTSTLSSTGFVRLPHSIQPTMSRNTWQWTS